MSCHHSSKYLLIKKIIFCYTLQISKNCLYVCIYVASSYLTICSIMYDLSKTGERLSKICGIYIYTRTFTFVYVCVCRYNSMLGVRLLQSVLKYIHLVLFIGYFTIIRSIFSFQLTLNYIYIFIYIFIYTYNIYIYYLLKS